MATNERVEYINNDLSHEQQSPSGINRTEWYPGKADSRENDLPFEKDFRVPQGTPAFDGEAAGPVEMQRTRVVKLGRGSVSDQTIPDPTVESTRVEAVSSDYVNGTHTVQETETVSNPADVEKLAGNDNIKGA